MNRVPCIRTSKVVLRKLSELETNQKFDDVAMQFLAKRCNQCLKKEIDEGVFYLPLDKQTTIYFKYSVPKITIDERPTIHLYDLDIVVNKPTTSSIGWLTDNRDAFIVSIVAGILVALGTGIFLY